VPKRAVKGRDRRADPDPTFPGSQIARERVVERRRPASAPTSRLVRDPPESNGAPPTREGERRVPTGGVPVGRGRLNAEDERGAAIRLPLNGFTFC